MLLVVGVVALGGGIAWVATRDRTPTTSGSNPTPPPLVQAEPLPIDTGGGARPLAGQGGTPPKAPGGVDVIQLAGKLGGMIAGESAFTNTGKDLSLPVGLGVSTIAVLAGAGASLASAAAWAAPVILITVAIVTIIDAIARTAQAEQWKQTIIQVRDLRASGQIREAFEVYTRAVGTLQVQGLDASGVPIPGANVHAEVSGGTISKISQVWPKPGEVDWYNPLAPRGEPYPGFPGPPKPATPAELRANPSLLPAVLTTTDGQTVPVKPLLDATLQDVIDARNWGLANGVPGRKVNGGQVVSGVTTGDRDISEWAPLRTRLENLRKIRTGIANAIPWLSRDCFETGFYSAAEIAVINATKAAAVVETARRTDIRNTRNFGGNPAAAAAAAAAVQAEAQAEAASRTASRAQGAPAGDANAAEDRTGARSPANRSGSGGRNG